MIWKVMWVIATLSRCNRMLAGSTQYFWTTFQKSLSTWTIISSPLFVLAIVISLSYITQYSRWRVCVCVCKRREHVLEHQSGVTSCNKAYKDVSFMIPDSEASAGQLTATIQSIDHWPVCVLQPWHIISIQLSKPYRFSPLREGGHCLLV